jgi:hypothetical protein
VVKLIDGESTESWLHRASAEGASSASASAESNSVARSLSDRSRDGWDPWDVWLRHIDQPRRHFAGRRLKSPD